MVFTDWISLLVLLAVIVIAFVFKANTGLVAIMASLILARITGISEKALLGMFDSKMFIMLLGVMYIFCIAQENGTLELLAKKILRLCRGKTFLFPPLLFLLSAVLSAIGPGLISVTALMAALVVAIAKETKTHPIKLLPFATLGSFAGGLSPITPSGIVAISKATENGILGLAWPLMWKMALTNILFAVILYFLFGCFKLKSSPEATKEKPAAFNWKQWATLLGIGATATIVALPTVLLNLLPQLKAILTPLKDINVGLVAISVSVILTIIGAANEGVALKKMPWGTVIMITGMGILISVVTELGGIELLSGWLSRLMNRFTANPIITVLAGVMSWFSSASGVVMPTLIPTVPGLTESLEGVSALGLTVGLCVGAHLAALSPLSSCGGLMLAAYSSTGIDAKERNKTFAQLFLMSACGVLFAGLLALTGLYN